MSLTKGEVILYGLDNLDCKINSIIDTLNLEKHHFDVKLIIYEAVSNAFIHGNNRDKNKPISIRWNVEDHLLNIYVTDCGSGFKDLKINKEINKDNILQEGGRGLYLINCYTDEMEFENNSIIMKKHIGNKAH